ncbi:major facilitator superfamily domain-containing protein [Aspergillus falconensis]
MPKELACQTPAKRKAAEAPQEIFKWDLDIWLNLIALWGCFFTSTWLLVVPNSTISFIAAAFPEDASISIWIASSVTIGNCVIQAFLGDVSDHFGRKWPLLVGMALGLAGSMIAGRADSMGMVIGGQVLNGIGLTCGYLAIPLSAEIVPKDQRARVQAISGVFAGVAYIVGPVVAGAFIKHNVGGNGEGWRVPFYLSAGLSGLTFILVASFYHPAPRPNPDKLSVMTRIFKIDWIGVFLATAGITLFLVGLESGGNPTPWVPGRVLACILVGGFCMVGFGLWEWLATKNGIVAHSLFTDATYPICLVLNFVSGIVLFGGQAFLPQEIATLFTSDAVMTGVWNIPFNAMTIGGGILSAIILGPTKEAKWTVVAAFVMLLAGNCLMLVVKPHINYAAWFFPTALMGTAVGIQTSLLIVVVGICTPNHLIAEAISVAAAARALGCSIGTVIFSQIFASKIEDFLPEEVAKEAIKAGLPQTSIPSFLQALLARQESALMAVPGVTPAIIAAGENGAAKAYAHGFKFVWYSLIPFAVISLGLSFGLRSTRAHLNRQVAAQVEHKHHHHA